MQIIPPTPKKWLTILPALVLMGCATTGNNGSADLAKASNTAALPTSTSDLAAAAQTEQERLDKERLTDVKIYRAEGSGLVNIPSLDSYLNTLLQRIQQTGPQPARYAKVYVLNEFSYNAFSRPTGNIYVDLGWLDKIASESELSALLAHEYGHISLEHLNDKNNIGTAVYAANLILLYSGKHISGRLANSAKSGYSAWSTLVMPQWGRSQELAADKFSYEINVKAGYSYTTGVKAFLESIKSFEPKALPPTGNAVDLSALKEDHPTADDRLVALNALYQEQPRVKHAKSLPDGWVKFKKTPEYRQKYSEYKIADDFMAAVDQNNNVEAMKLGAALEKLAPKSNSMAAVALAIYEARRGNSTSADRYMEQAIEAPDASFEAYKVKYMASQAQGKNDDAYHTMMDGYNHFDAPPGLLTELIRFDKDIIEKIQTIPQQQWTMAQSLTNLQSGARMTKNLIQCKIYAIYADSCSDASLTVAQRLDRERKAKQQSEDQAKAISDKIEKKINKLTH